MAFWFFFLLLLGNLDFKGEPERFIWKNRILIYSGKSDISSWLSDSYMDDFSDRKLLYFHFQDGRLINSNYKGEVDEEAFLKKLKPNAKHAEQWVLIGLDGGVKNIGFSKPEPPEILRIIDAMPMRQSEIRKRNSE